MYVCMYVCTYVRTYVRMSCVALQLVVEAWIAALAVLRGNGAERPDGGLASELHKEGIVKVLFIVGGPSPPLYYHSGIYICIYIYIYTCEGLRRQGSRLIGSAVRNSYVSALCLVFLCPYLCSSYSLYHN